MFYLAARGVDRKEARKLLLRGFVFDLLENSIMDEKSLEKVKRKLTLLNPLVDVSGKSSQGFTSI